MSNKKKQQKPAKVKQPKPLPRPAVEPGGTKKQMSLDPLRLIQAVPPPPDVRTSDANSDKKD